MKTIRVVPDTNLFLQCRALAELGWSQVTDAEKVIVMLTAPVQRELDRLKADGNARRARRARDVNTLLRELFRQGPRGEIQVRATAPVVVLQAPLEVQPTPDLQFLNYAGLDHQIVGIAHALSAAEETHVLTDDGGVLWAARAVDVPALEIPMDWMLPREPSEVDKLRTEMEQRFKKIGSDAPRFEVEVLDDRCQPIEKLAGAITVHTASSRGPVDTLINKVRQRFPPEVRFGPAPGEQRSFFYQYRPPSRSAVAEYQQAFMAWEGEIERLLSAHHDVLTRLFQPPFCRFRVANIGSRPAGGALVKFTSKGNLLINHLDDEPKAQLPALPVPPDPPRGRWVDPNAPHRSPPSASDLKGELPRSFTQLLQGVEAVDPPYPDEFRFREKPTEPVRSFELDCQQWRHGRAPEEFLVGVYPEDRAGSQIRGAIELEIHAENLAEPVKRVVPVRIDVTLESALDSAVEMVARLLGDRP